MADDVFPVYLDNPTMQRLALNAANILDIIHKSPNSWEVDIGMMAALVDLMRLIRPNEKEVLYWQNQTRFLYGMSQLHQIIPLAGDD